MLTDHVCPYFYVKVPCMRLPIFMRTFRFVHMGINRIKNSSVAGAFANLTTDVHPTSLRNDYIFAEPVKSGDRSELARLSITSLKWKILTGQANEMRQTRAAKAIFSAWPILKWLARERYRSSALWPSKEIIIRVQTTKRRARVLELFEHKRLARPLNANDSSRKFHGVTLPRGRLFRRSRIHGNYFLSPIFNASFLANVGARNCKSDEAE